MSDRLRAAYAAIDEENGRDPRRAPDVGLPAELVYGQRMTAWLERLEPHASEVLRVAVRAQHLGRYAVPREQYPEGRAGYRRWRGDLARRHAEGAAAIAAAAGFAAAEVGRVRDLVLKKGVKVDPEAQLLEDAACLVFLEHHFAELAGRTERGKMIDIVQKTWRKMSPRAHAEALALPLPPALRSIVEDALAAPSPAAEAP